MWQVHGNKVALRLGILIAAVYLNPTNAYADESFQLPGVTLSQGTDEVRAADGTSCRSSVGGSGAYVDMGLIGKKGVSNDGSYYGRLVVPLGKSSKRIDCSKLYELEVERLKLELELAKAGLGRQEDTTLDQTETSSLEEETEPSDQNVANEKTAALNEESSIEEPVAELPAKKKKKAKVVAAVEEQAPKKPAKVAKLKKNKVGDADWANEGWSTGGRQTN
jgi:hypothetical protein